MIANPTIQFNRCIALFAIARTRALLYALQNGASNNYSRAIGYEDDYPVDILATS